MSDDKLQAAINKGAKAKALVDNEVLTEAFFKLENEYIKAWRNWHATDTDGRERLWTAVNVLGKVRDNLNRMISDGKIAQTQLEELIRNN